ncbi:hypothetical protein AC1031_016807 [Aphanomyces cochlioides]|nr:hypothetical protein AC1031_016807 [Aphanomyces cochlioides]
MLTVVCVVVGEGRPFPVEAEAGNLVGTLQDKIKVKKTSITCDADQLELYMVDGLAQIGKTRFDFKGTMIDDMPAKLLDDFDGSTMEMVATYKLSSYPQLNVSSDGRIHVLVVVPDGAGLLEHAVSHSKHLHCKGMSVEASCRKYLDAIAKQISLTYDFPQQFTQNPTIGDAFRAVDKKTWTYRRLREITLMNKYVLSITKLTL